MRIVSVIPLGKVVFKEDLTYFTAKEVAPGSIVGITLRNKKMLGLAVSSEEVSTEKGNIKELNFGLKKILEVKEHSIFDNAFFDSALQTGKYFAVNKNISVASLIPNILVNDYDKIAKFAHKNNSTPESIKKIKAEKLFLQTPLEDRISFYKTLIRTSFAAKKSVFIVLPTEHDVELWSVTLAKGVENFTFSFHSGIAQKKSLAALEKLMTSAHPVLVLATAPYLAIPRRDIGTVILEHESSNAYRMVARPYFDLRIFTEIFAEKINAKFILADTLLRFETIERREIDGLTPMHNPSFRTDFEGKLEIVDKASKEKKFKVLTDDTLEEIRKALEEKKKIFIFSLRKGLSTMTICRDCGNVLMCDVCSAPLVLYLSRDGNKRMFACNRCKREINPETKCATCYSWNLVPIGIGTDTVVEAIKDAFPKEKNIFKLDKESAKTEKGAEKIAKDFENSKGGIMVGTEMALHYMKNKVPYSIIASFDSLWGIPNFRISEKIVQLMLSIINKTEKRIIIETKNVRDPAILSVASGNLLHFIREELEDRKKLGYPPFKRFIKVTYAGDKDKISEARRILVEMFKDYNPEIFSGFVAKQKDKYITNMLIKMEPRSWSVPELAHNSSINENLLNKLLSLPPNFTVLVDPEDLL